jgi:ABC-2 type transport system ATP-binding protein
VAGTAGVGGVNGIPLIARGIVQYGRGREAPEILRGVNLDIPDGLSALVGPNGSGKTTLLRTLAGLLPPWEGHVEVEGVALQDNPGQVRRLVGYLPQFPGMFRRLTVRQHFERQELWLGAQRGRSMADALSRFGLSGRAEAPARLLSMGERRRLAIALLWARAARVLLLDEPTAGLDLEERLTFWEQLLELLYEADSVRAVVVTTHLLDEVERYCHYVAMLTGGRAVFQGPVAKMRERGASRAFVVRGGVLPPGALEVGVDPETGERWGLGLLDEPPPDAPRRPPLLLDGYLVLERQWDPEQAS